MMPQINDVGALRDWLRTCPAIARESAFGVDYLGDMPGGFALCSVPSEAKYRENILGEAAPMPRQSRDFWLDVRAPYGADAGQNLDNLALMRSIADWIRAQSAAGNLPEWQGVRVTGIVPAAGVSVEDAGSDAARYRMRMRVEYEIREQATGNREQGTEEIPLSIE